MLSARVFVSSISTGPPVTVGRGFYGHGCGTPPNSLRRGNSWILILCPNLRTRHDGAYLMFLFSHSLPRFQSPHASRGDASYGCWVS